jgi:hypothetical protein
MNTASCGGLHSSSSWLVLLLHAAAVAARPLFGEELRLGSDHRQAVVLLGVGDLTLELQVATEIQGPPGLLQVRLGTLGPTLGSAVGHLLKLPFALCRLLFGRGADLLAGADLLHHEPLELGTHRVDQPLRADRQVERGGDGRQNLRSENGRDRGRRRRTVALFG